VFFVKVFREIFLHLRAAFVYADMLYHGIRNFVVILELFYGNEHLLKHLGCNWTADISIIIIIFGFIFVWFEFMEEMEGIHEILRCFHLFKTELLAAEEFIVFCHNISFFVLPAKTEEHFTSIFTLICIFSLQLFAQQTLNVPNIGKRRDKSIEFVSEIQRSIQKKNEIKSRI